MNTKEIKKHIVESLLEGKELIESLMIKIENDSELNEYYKEMKSLLSHKDDEEYDPGSEYFDKAWNEIEEKIDAVPVIIPFYQQPWFKNVAVIMIITLSFYIGTIQKPIDTNSNERGVVKNEKLRSLFRNYNVTLTSFVNMDEYESHDLLKVVIKSSKKLLRDTRDLKKVYESNDDVYQLLSDLEPILFAIILLQDQSASKVQVMQFRLQSEIDIDQDLETQI